jgi:anti-anti-sigma regulatory factor
MHYSRNPTMDCEHIGISFSAEPAHCVLRLAGGLGVAEAEELRGVALELCAYRKDVLVDCGAATQIDTSVAQVLLALAAGLRAQNRSLAATGTIPAGIRSWLREAGLSGLLEEAVES